MRIAVSILFFIFCHHACLSQASAAAEVSVTIASSDELAYIQHLQDEVLTWKLPRKSANAKAARYVEVQQGYKHEAVVTAFEVGSTHEYWVSLPNNAIVIKRLSGPETLRFSSFRLAPSAATQKTKHSNSVVEATVESTANPAAGIYVSQTSLDVTVHFN